MNYVQSDRCPGVTTRDSGRQRPFALRWSLLVNPPREWPRPSSPAALPPDGRPVLVFWRFTHPLNRGGRRIGPGSGHVLMCADNGEVDRDIPVDLSSGVAVVPSAVSRPQTVSFVDGLPRAEPFRQVTPLHARPNPVQNPADHLPMVPPPAITPVADGQERTESFPLGIAQIAPPRTRVNTPGTRPLRDRPDKYGGPAAWQAAWTKVGRRCIWSERKTVRTPLATECGPSIADRDY